MILLLLILHLGAEELAGVPVDTLRRHVGFLSSDDLEGRCAGEAGSEKAADYIEQQLLEIGLEPRRQSFEFRAKGKKGPINTENVFALIEGSDPELKNKALVLGAHYDHVGTADSISSGRSGKASKTDRIWNGADDNASGTSSLLALAELFKNTAQPLRHSLVLVFFSAEEQGLLGSAHYAANADLPMRCMINLDMVGRNPDKPLEISGLDSMGERRWYELVQTALKTTPALKIKEVGHTIPASDDFSFVRVNVPAIALFSGYHPEYHKIGDHADLVAYDRMVEICRFTETLVREVDGFEGEITFDRAAIQGKKIQVAKGKELGVTTSVREEGGVRIDSVAEGSIGAKMGLLVGDVVVSVRGRSIRGSSAADSFRRAVKGASYNRDHKLTVLRDGKRVTLTFRFARAKPR